MEHTSSRFSLIDVDPLAGGEILEADCGNIPFVRDSSSHLNLWKKQLGQVPDAVWEQTQLETLVLAENELTNVSEHVGRLKKLRMLDLGHNLLTWLPDSLGDLDGLTDFLYLHDNRLASLPSSLERLRRLHYLNISENARGSVLNER